MTILKLTTIEPRGTAVDHAVSLLFGRIDIKKVHFYQNFSFEYFCNVTEFSQNSNLILKIRFI